MKTILAVSMLVLVSAMALPVGADPTEIVTISSVRPIASMEAASEGATIRWWTPVDVIHPAGYHVYRGVPMVTGGSPGIQLVAIGTVLYHGGDQVYSFFDADYKANHVTVYYVRAFLNDQEGPPSNPVTDYPPCDWVQVSQEYPFVTLNPECLIPAI